MATPTRRKLRSAAGASPSASRPPAGPRATARPETARSDAAPDAGALHDDGSRTDLLNRLRRAEGQLRGIQRMIEEGADCLALAGQMSAVRKALDATYVRMTVCFMAQELGQHVGAAGQDRITPVLDQIEALLGKVR